MFKLMERYPEIENEEMGIDDKQVDTIDTRKRAIGDYLFYYTLFKCLYILSFYPYLL